MIDVAEIREDYRKALLESFEAVEFDAINKIFTVSKKASKLRFFREGSEAPEGYKTVAGVDPVRCFAKNWILYKKEA